MRISLAVKDGEGKTVCSFEGTSFLHALIEREYLPGDTLEVTGAEHLMIRLDQCLGEGEVFAPSGRFTYAIPFQAERIAYAPFAFEGDRHIVTIREMTREEILGERVISSNPHDLRVETDAFPHATANVETRGEACFAARNVIDGLYTNHGHGCWPYGSWGIGTKTDAALTIDLGRKVAASRVRVLLRADFPHDSWWEECTLVFSDGSREILHLDKTDAFQEMEISKTISWIRIEGLKKADDPSPFPSLRQLEVLGRDLP